MCPFHAFHSLHLHLYTAGYACVHLGFLGDGVARDVARGHAHPTPAVLV